jgi:hypothetical protein
MLKFLIGIYLTTLVPKILNRIKGVEDKSDKVSK